MTAEPARAGAGWLRMREPADAAARAADLVDLLQPLLPSPCTAHDLGCGSGSMVRWLAARLAGPQHWVLHDRDTDLLPLAAADPPGAAADGSPVTVETRAGDLAVIDPNALAGADLVTASALLDMLTREELDCFLDVTTRAGAPVLVAMSVTGDVRLDPVDRRDGPIVAAFNAHQRRDAGSGPLLGPDAVRVAEAEYRRRGFDVHLRPSPWRLGPGERDLARAWFTGWVRAAREQDPALAGDTSYVRRRYAEIGAGALKVHVGHRDLLALPR